MEPQTPVTCCVFVQQPQHHRVLHKLVLHPNQAQSAYSSPCMAYGETGNGQPVDDAAAAAVDDVAAAAIVAGDVVAAAVVGGVYGVGDVVGVVGSVGVVKVKMKVRWMGEGVTLTAVIAIRTSRWPVDGNSLLLRGSLAVSAYGSAIIKSIQCFEVL